VLRNIGSPEAIIPHFSLSLRNLFLQNRLWSWLTSPTLASKVSSISARHKSTPFFLSALPQTDAFAKALKTDSLERGIEPGRSRSSVGPGPGLAVDVDAMVSVRQFVLVVAVRQKSVLRRFLQHHLRRRISGMYHCNVTFLFMFWSGIE
jgi:hypothetical protein